MAASGDQVEEIKGGMLNAIARGESIDIARVSFLNAGYPPQIVDLAANDLLGQEAPTQKTVQVHDVNVPQSNLGLYAQQGAASQQSSPAENRRYSHMPVPYWAVILMLLIALGIVIGAGVLGLYWGKIFPGG